MTTDEDPLFQKCCFVIPLKLSLHTWASIKMAASVVVVGGLVFLSFLLVAFRTGDILTYLLFNLIVIHLLVDIGFNSFLMVGVCKKNCSYLRTYYRYSIYSVILEPILIGLFTLWFMIVSREDIWIFVGFLGVGLLYILLEVCVLLTVKSEMIKLRNKEQYDFAILPRTPEDAEENSC